LSDQSARQEARVRKELEALDKEGGSVGREGIVIPARKSGEFLFFGDGQRVSDDNGRAGEAYAECEEDTTESEDFCESS
jgi:hypothetical protein